VSTLTAYAIRQISTGHYLPDARRNWSTVEPTPDCIPRLFESRHGANSALARWCEGLWRQENTSIYTDCGWEHDAEFYAVPVEGRDRKDMEVVPVVLVLT
jgi:hypothetical protein